MRELLRNAREYCESNGRTLDEKALLGAGTDGSVWKTNEGTAVKALELLRNYANERDCYRRLSDAGIAEIKGFAVPELEGYSDDLWVIEMSIVQPPYLLDFGKAYLDSPADYFDDEEREQTWRLRCMEDFGDDWPRVQSVIRILAVKVGIYYYDVKPANIQVSGLA